MKILYLTHYDRLYGANRALLQLATQVQSEGAHEAIVVVPSEGEFGAILRKAGVRVVIHPITQWQGIYVEAISFARKRQRRMAQIEAELASLYDLFHAEGIDLIHSNSSVIGTGAMLAARLGCRHVWHIREYAQEHYGMAYYYPEEKVREYYAQADCLITISDALQDAVRARYPDARVTRIYDGIEIGPGDDASVPDEPAASDDALPVRFLYTGYLFPAKRQLDVCRAAALLRSSGVERFTVTLAGDGDGAYHRRLARYIGHHRLRDHVRLAGFVEDMEALLCESDVGIIASVYEGFGLATAEYMRAGLPVIGRESGATPELVAAGETGLLYRDEAGLAEAMQWMVEHGRERAQMGAAGRERVMTRFTQAQNTAAVVRLYEAL